MQFCVAQWSVGRMRFTSRRLKRELVALALVAGSALTYFSLLGMRWDIYVTLCVAYTILIIGMAWANGKWKLYFSRGSSDISRFFQIHIGFVLAIVLLVWLAMWGQPAMPDWLVARGDDRWSWYHIVVIALVVGVVLIEQWWFEKKPRRDAS
jgi:hypothetical protein